MGSVVRKGKLERFFSGVVIKGKCLEEYDLSERGEILKDMSVERLRHVAQQLCEALTRTWGIYNVRRDAIARVPGRQGAKGTIPGTSKPV